MSNYEKIYWITRLDGIHSLFVSMAVISVLSIIAIIIAIYYYRDFIHFYEGEALKARLSIIAKLNKLLKIAFITASIGIIVSTFLPTKNEAIAIIAGGKTIDFIQKDKSISKIPSQTTLLISKLLDEKISELDSIK